MAETAFEQAQEQMKHAFNFDEKKQAVADQTPLQPEVAGQAPAETTPPTPEFDPIAWFKKEISDDVDSIEAIKAKLNPAAPEPIYKEPEFANEESKRIYTALTLGNAKEVKDYLDKQELVKSLKEKSPADLVKEGWKNEFNLNDAQAQKRFDKMFGVDDLLEDDEKEIELKIKSKEIEREADRYKDYFAKYETEIKLPSIERPAPASAIQPETEEAKKADAFAAELSKSLPIEKNIGFEYNDEKSGLKLAGQVTIPQDEVQKIQSQMSGYEDKFLARRWFNADGSANDSLIATDIYTLTNIPKIVNAAVADAVNQTRIKLLAENRNHQSQGPAPTGEFELSETEQKQAWYKKNFM